MEAEQEKSNPKTNTNPTAANINHTSSKNGHGKVKCNGVAKLDYSECLAHIPNWKEKPATKAEWNLTKALLPIGDDPQYEEAFKWCRLTIASLPPEYDLVLLLKYNRSHKKGGLVISNGQQMYKALVEYNTLLPEWLTHECDACAKCKTLGLYGSWVKKRRCPDCERDPEYGISDPQNCPSCLEKSKACINHEN